MAQQTGVEPPANASGNSPAQDATLRSETHSASPPPSRREEFFRKRPQARMWLIIAGIVLVVAIVFAWRYFASYESTDDAQVDGHLMPLSARISGYIIDVNQVAQALSVPA